MACIAGEQENACWFQAASRHGASVIV